MSSEGAPESGNPADTLNAQLRQLEAFVLNAEAEGELLPPEALEMVDRLREITQALDGLTSSLVVAGEGTSPDEVTGEARKIV